MLKIVHLARRRPDVTHRALIAHWRDVNVAEVAAESEPDRYVVTFFRPAAAMAAHSWDGMAVVHFTDERRGLAMLEDLPPAARRNGFADLLAEVVRFRADEHVFFGDPTAVLPAGAVKLTFLVVPRPGVHHAELVDHWVRVHGPAVAGPMTGIEGALRYVASPAHQPVGGYAGVTELCYASREASANHAAALVEDGFGRLADNSLFLVGEELIVR